MKRMLRGVLLMFTGLALVIPSTSAQATDSRPKSANGWRLSTTGACPIGTAPLPRLGAETKYRVAWRTLHGKGLTRKQLTRLVICVPNAAAQSAAAAVASAAATSAPPAALVAPAVEAPAWQANMLAIINATRVRAGVKELNLCPAINRAAQLYAEQMAATGLFAHVGADGSKAWERMKAQAYNWRSAGENIARGQDDVDVVMAAWIASPGHYANLINSNFRHVGLGLTVDASGSKWWVQDFGSGGTC